VTKNLSSEQKKEKFKVFKRKKEEMDSRLRGNDIEMGMVNQNAPNSLA
jgi:hypothetical protein